MERACVEPERRTTAGRTKKSYARRKCAQAARFCGYVRQKTNRRCGQIARLSTGRENGVQWRSASDRARAVTLLYWTTVLLRGSGNSSSDLCVHNPVFFHTRWRLLQAFDLPAITLQLSAEVFPYTAEALGAASKCDCSMRPGALQRSLRRGERQACAAPRQYREWLCMPRIERTTE
jgi:hypothetical protein